MSAMRGLNFHGIGAASRPMEAGEDDFWISQSRFREILDSISNRPGGDRIFLTFDDGNLSDRLLALPQLLERGLKAAFFVLTGRIGRLGSLDADDIRALSAAGMEVGSHGVAHRDWSRLSPSELEAEVGRSRAVLQEICGAPVRSAAIPFGKYNASVLRALRQAGYACAYSSDGGAMDAAAFVRPRTSMRASMDLAAIEAVAAGRESVIRRMKRRISMTKRRLL